MGISDVQTAGRGPVVVGTDGSEHGARAVERAAAEAVRTGVPLRIVHAVRVPIAVPGYAPVEPGREARGAAGAVVEEAIQAAVKRHPGLEVEGRVAAGMPGDALLDAAEDASLLVAGSRGHGGFAGLLLGSVSRFLIARTPCPLLIVRGARGVATTGAEPRLDGEDVLLGVQGEGDASAARAAFEAARRWGLPLHALHAWSWPGYPGLTGPSDKDLAAVTEVHQQCLDGALGGVRAGFPDVAVEESSVYADAAGALVEASQAAALAVVGVRHRRGPLRHWVGHVAATVVEHANCPVLIVPMD